MHLRSGTRFIILGTFDIHIKWTQYHALAQIVQRYLLCHFSFVSYEPQSLRKKYGAVFSMRVGSFQVVVADDADSVKEVLCKKSADYAGRPPFHSYTANTLGMVCISTYSKLQINHITPLYKTKTCNY